MNLSVNYLGINLPGPIIVGSSNLTNSVKKIKKCAEQGAGAVVIKSLFEEQILVDKGKLMSQEDMYFWYPEAVEFVNNFSKEEGVEQYLNLIKEAKSNVDIPVIASINCVSPNEWPVFASEIEKSGADALELNVQINPTKTLDEPKKIEELYFEIIKKVKENTVLPIAVKIGYHFTDLAGFIKKICATGVDGLVLFNRFYRPDIDINTMNIVHSNVFSSAEELTTTLRWVGLMSGRIDCDIAASTGIHDHAGVIKQLLAGASAVQVCSALYKNGIEYLGTMQNELKKWMEKNRFESIRDFKGKVSDDEELAEAFERVQFMKKTTGEY